MGKKRDAAYFPPYDPTQPVSKYNVPPGARFVTVEEPVKNSMSIEVYRTTGPAADFLADVEWVTVTEEGTLVVKTKHGSLNYLAGDWKRMDVS